MLDKQIDEITLHKIILVLFFSFNVRLSQTIWSGTCNAITRVWRIFDLIQFSSIVFSIKATNTFKKTTQDGGDATKSKRMKNDASLYN